MSVNDTHMHTDPSLDPERSVAGVEKDRMVLAEGLRAECAICTKKPAKSVKEPVK